MVILSQQNNSDKENLLLDEESFEIIKNKRAVIEIFIDKYLDSYFENYEETK